MSAWVHSHSCTPVNRLRIMHALPSHSYWNDRHAIVSGGSSGLGRHLALALARSRAHLAVVGRNRERLESLRVEAMEAGARSVRVFSVDICKSHDGSALSPDVTSTHPTPHDDQESWLEHCRSQPCDVLINAVGKSDRGLLQHLTASEVLEQFRTNVLGTLQLTQCCWPMLQKTNGVVVNIASLAGLIAAPKLGGYSIAKHGLVAMHRQWRAETTGSGVHFLLVCPGPIQRDDAADRYAYLIESRGLDAAASRPGGGVDIQRLNPIELSQRILRAAENRELELVLPGKAKWLAALMPLWPSWADRILRKKMA
jgi:uncharacterized protein